ncbi:sialate O-acetylesterase [Pseudoroseicyclus tamaricis]|uniref:Sialate O-acetylesterase n=1 Tax=Pseudoroseicyclus tamaricis TaxID=2705421 RepID=A0A6B2JZ11_9RHOB|nr:sialate O-acetylesterase [Pseudoroseicyclus tamaricis]NDV01849.1 sialate O-acetylesterase [Pseudoroseicyclus tamaricis]
MIGPSVGLGAQARPRAIPATFYAFDRPELMFQDAEETVPVTADGDPVAVVLARSGPRPVELPVVNGSFDSDLAGWTIANGNGVWVDGRARVARTSTTASICQAVSLQAGLRYRFGAEATWIGGSDCTAALVLRTGADWTSANLGHVALAPAASGTLELDYTPTQDEVVHLHLSVTSASGAVEFDDITLTADPRRRLVTAAPERRPLWRTDGRRHWLEFDGQDDCLEASGPAPGLAGYAGGIWASYRPLTTDGGFVWCAGSQTEVATSLTAASTGDAVRLGGGAATVMDAGLHDKHALALWDRTASTGRVGRRGKGVAAALGEESADGPLAIGARLATAPDSPLAMRLYGLAVAEAPVDAAAREQVTAAVSALGRPDVPRRLHVLLVGGQSNADGRVAVADGPAWLQGSLVPGVRAWTGERLEETYWLTPAEGTGASYVTTGASGCFGFADVAAKGLAEASGVDLAICRVTEGGTAVDPGANPRGSWHADDAAIPAGTPKLLAALEARYAALAAWATARGVELVPVALLWHQGEASAASSGAVFRAQTEAVFARVRAFTGQGALPVISGTISHASAQYTVAIEAAMQAIDAADPDAHYRDNSALTLFDGLHFDAASAETFGEWAATRLAARL